MTCTETFKFQHESQTTFSALESKPSNHSTKSAHTWMNASVTGFYSAAAQKSNRSKFFLNTLKPCKVNYPRNALCSESEVVTSSVLKNWRKPLTRSDWIIKSHCPSYGYLGVPNMMSRVFWFWRTRKGRRADANSIRVMCEWPNYCLSKLGRVVVRSGDVIFKRVVFPW